MTDVGASATFDPWPHAQVHVEWGTAGAAAAAARGDIVVVVDVLSFSTTLAVGVERGFTCLVHSPAEVAAMGGLEAAGAEVAARPISTDRRVEPGGISLSPASLLTAEPGQRVLFTSLNGAAAVAAGAGAPALLVAGLRNATAGAALAARFLAGRTAQRVTIVAAAEHWTSVMPGTPGIRPALEDWVGAGAICARLAADGHTLSAEAAAAAAAATPTGVAALHGCVSARELIESGFVDDVTAALAVDAGDTVAVRLDSEPGGRTFTGVTPAC